MVEIEFVVDEDDDTFVSQLVIDVLHTLVLENDEMQSTICIDLFCEQNAFTMLRIHLVEYNECDENDEIDEEFIVIQQWWQLAQMSIDETDENDEIEQRFWFDIVVNCRNEQFVVVDDVDENDDVELHLEQLEQTERLDVWFIAKGMYNENDCLWWAVFFWFILCIHNSEV